MQSEGVFRGSIQLQGKAEQSQLTGTLIVTETEEHNYPEMKPLQTQFGNFLTQVVSSGLLHLSSPVPQLPLGFVAQSTVSQPNGLGILTASIPNLNTCSNHMSSVHNLWNHSCSTGKIRLACNTSSARTLGMTADEVSGMCVVHWSQISSKAAPKGNA